MIVRIKRESETEYLQHMARLYEQSGQRQPATGRMIAEWAIKLNLWDQPERDEVGILAAKITGALRVEFETDHEGRKVRRNHTCKKPVKTATGEIEQRDFWFTMETGEPEDMCASFDQRRAQIKGTCRQLKTDVDSYNERDRVGVMYQLELNFEIDLGDEAQPTEYPGLKV